MEELKGIDDKTVVHCSTKELAIEVLLLAKKLGVDWYPGCDLSRETLWKDYKSRTCYNLFSKSYGSLEYYQKEGHNIITSEEFIDMNEEFTLPEKWCVRPKHWDKEQCETVLKWFNRKSKHQYSSGREYNYYWHYPSLITDSSYRFNLMKPGYNEITFRQFKKYVMKEKNEFKVGDVLFSTKQIYDYREKKYIPVFKVEEIRDGWLRPEKFHSTGTESWGCRLATQEEIKQYAPYLLEQESMKTYPVTREQLKEIYDIACSDWKEIIDKITREVLGLFNNEGWISEEMVNSMYSAATQQQLPIIKRIFPRKKIVTKEISGWLNVYSYNSHFHNTKESADRVSTGRIACVEVKGTYEIEVED